MFTQALALALMLQSPVAIRDTSIVGSDGLVYVSYTQDIMPYYINLYVDGQLTVRQNTQVQGAPLDWLVWQPSPSDYGLERELRIEALDSSRRVISNDTYPVYVWTQGNTGFLRITMSKLNLVPVVLVTHSLPGRSIPADVSMYVDDILVSSVMQTRGQSITLPWTPTPDDYAKQHIIRVDTSVPLFGTQSDIQIVKLK